MHFLRNNTFIIIFILCGCSSTTYKASTDKDNGAKVVTTPDRFLPYCEKVIKDDGAVVYGFMVFFLDDIKTVGTATGMLTNKTTCLKWKSGVQKILNGGKLITLKGFGNLERPREMEDFSHHFKGHGSYNSNGRSMDFFSVSNELGRCYSVDTDRCVQRK